MDKILLENLLCFAIKNRYLFAVKKISEMLRKNNIEISTWLKWCTIIIHIDSKIQMQKFLDIIKVSNYINLESDNFPKITYHLNHFKSYSKRLALNYLLENNFSDINNLVQCIFLLNKYFDPMTTVQSDLKYRSRYLQAVSNEDELKGWIANGWPALKENMFSKLRRIIDNILLLLPETLFCKDHRNEVLEELRSVNSSLSIALSNTMAGKCWLFEEDVMAALEACSVTIND